MTQPPPAPSEWGQRQWGHQQWAQPQWGQPQHYPPAPPPRRSGWPIALFVAGAVLVLLLGVVFGQWVSAQNSPEPADTSATTASSPEATPSSPGPQTGSPPVNPDLPYPAEVQQHPINSLPVLVAQNCPEFSGTQSNLAAKQQQARELLTCLHASWARALASTTVDLAEPDLHFYDESVTSPCGTISDTIFYCNDQAGSMGIYVSNPLLQRYAAGQWRLAVVNIMVHEYFHHVQHSVGLIPAARAAADDRYDVSRRIELQAMCASVATVVRTPEWRFDERERQQLTRWWAGINEKIHGNPTSNRYWGERGLEATMIGECNTFVVAPEKVA